MKSLFLALLVAMVSLSSCEFFPGEGPIDPPGGGGGYEEPVALTTNFWVSGAEYGQEQMTFKKSDDIYFNYTLKNNSKVPVKWNQADGGPFVGYTVTGVGIASSFYAVHPEMTPTVIQEGVLQPGEEIRYSWKATETVQFPADHFVAQADVRRNFEGMFTVPASVRFTVAD
ncbi:MAG: hypothetical protein V4642_04425 [Bacteroidota bacterium]